MQPPSPIYTPLLFFLVFILANTAPSPSYTDTSLQSIETSSSSLNAIFNYRIRDLTISLEFGPLQGRPSRPINPVRWNRLVINAHGGIIARSHGHGGAGGRVQFSFNLDSFGIYIEIVPQLSEGGFTYGEMAEIDLALRTVGGNINYEEFSCKIFRTNRRGLRVSQIGTMMVEETGPSSGQSGEIGAIEDALGKNLTVEEYSPFQSSRKRLRSLTSA
ncbi:MAG: hypothetical protein Q9167_002799 [Letrouitia subvulpina]